VIQPRDIECGPHALKRGLLPPLLCERLELRAYLATGDLDSTFGAGGIVVPSGYTLEANVSARAAALDAEGRLIIVGGLNDPAAAAGTGQTGIVIARYNLDGTLDATFDGDGVAMPAVPAGGGFSAVAVQPDGQILLAGTIDPECRWQSRRHVRHGRCRAYPVS
jgi:uncharacterized delta-60 repeat protein